MALIKAKTISLKKSERTFDSTFDKICKLQSLLKEEQAIKERFENDKKEMLYQIEKNCFNYYKNKVAIQEAYDYIKENDIHFEYTLLENPKEKLKIYNELYQFFFIFRNSNKMTLELIRNCDKADYESLSYFFVHSFYENILSASFAQEDILVIIYLLLEEWIDNKLLSSPNLSSFLNGSFLLDIFKSMTRKEDVRLYLQAILSEIVWKMENITEGISNVEGLDTSINEQDKDKSQEITNSESIIEDSNKECVVNNNKEKINNFIESTETSLSYIQGLLKEYEDKDDDSKKNLEIRDYLNKQISFITSNEDKEEIFSSKYAIESLSDEKKEKIVQNGEKIQSLLDNIMKNLEENLTGIPYSIKCICKSIDYLIQQKFKNEDPKPSSFEQLMYIVKFFFGFLIIPTFENPEYNGIITTSIISEETKKKLSFFITIFNQILEGSLFTKEKKEYTIFNKFILQFMPRIIHLVHWVRKTKLPSVIEKLIAKKNSPDRDIEYYFFRENPNENIQHQSVCFSKENAYIFAKILKNKPQIYESEKPENKQIIKKIISALDNYTKNNNTFKTSDKDDNDDKKQEEKVEFVYISKINYRPEFENQLNGIIVCNPITNTKISFDLVQKINLKTLKNIEKQKKEEVKEEKKEDKIIDNIKKCIIEILTNINILTPENLELNIVNSYNKDTDSFDKYLLPKIIKLLKFENNNFLNQITYPIIPNKKKKIPIGFYATIIQMNLQKIPIEYSQNNYSLLLTKLIKDSEQRVKDAKNDVINQLYLKIKISDRLNMIINSNLYQMKQLEKCINIDKFVHNAKIPCILSVKRELPDMITKVEIEEVETSEMKIKHFIKDFPDFSRLKIDDVIKYEEDIEMDKVLLKYFSIIKKYLKTYEKFEKYSKEEINSIIDELNNYILSKIYEKLFPMKCTKKDIKIYNKCKRLAWIQPKHLIKEKKVVNEKLWKTAMDFINLMETEKTPANKIKTFGKAFSIIQNSITFCTGKDELGVDDTIQILIYIILKAKPKRISSNFNYSALFIEPELSKKQYGLLLTQMEMIMTIIENMKYSDLINVKPEEFGEDLKEEDINIDDVSLLE